MNLTPRTKFLADINTDGKIIVGTAIAGFQTIAARLGFALLGSQYLLEDGLDRWEIGVCDPYGDRVAAFSSAGPFDADTTGYTCSIVALPTCYLNTSPSSTGLVTPIPAVGQNAHDSLAGGRNASVGDASASSVALGAGAFITTQAPRSVVLGANTYVGYNHAGATALGHNARATQPGEVVLGDRYRPHIGFLAVSGGPNIESGGTSDLFAISDATGEADMAYASLGSLKPDGNGYYAADIRVTGTVSVTSTNEADRKVFDVDYLVTHDANGSPVSTLYFNSTVMFNGASNIAATLSLNASSQLQITNPAITGLRVMGLLTLTKIMRG